MSGEVVPLRAGGRIAPIIPTTFEDVQRMAKMAVSSGLAPRAWNDDDATAVAKAIAVIMHGLECGVSPMQSLQNISVINGRTVMWGELLVAVLLSHGFKVKMWTEGVADARVGKARLTRPDGEVTETSFSVAQAKQARLWDERQIVRKKGKNGSEYDAPNDSAWFKFPEDMLEWKALGRANRRGGSDATRGLMIRQDMDDDTRTIDVTPNAATVSTIPDIPDIPDEPPADDNAILREIERALQHMTPEGVHHQFSTAIMAMDEDSRAAALEMIEASKAAE
jgi:hypothetical protein